MQSGRGLGQDQHSRPAPKHGKDKTPLLKTSAGGSKEGEIDLGKPWVEESPGLTRKPR